MDSLLIYCLAAAPWEWFWITVSFIIAVACGWNIGYDHAMSMKQADAPRREDTIHPCQRRK